MEEQVAMMRPVSHFAPRSVLFDGLEYGADPRELLASLLQKDVSEITESEDMVWKKLYDLTYHGGMAASQKPILDNFSSVLSLIEKSNKVVVILGAGGSVGPDFRSVGGLYDSIAKDGVFDDPCQVFDLEYFQKDPSIFWRYAHTIFPDRQPKHSAAHYFIQELENRGKLLRLYTQNVDALDIGVPPKHLRTVHGSWRESYCMKCGALHHIEDIRDAVEKREVPTCHFCGGAIKPGIVFFGQSVNLNDYELEMDAHAADLLIVIGTSLRVAPVSEIPKLMKNVPSILINRETVKCDFSAELLGECDDVVRTIEYELGWEADEGVNPEEIQTYGSNQFIFPSNSELGARIETTSRNQFLVTSAPVDVDDLN
ncbi:silent information regulator 2-like protein, putative [Trichomonas vaginalis G3]|uniref:Silent information regulator 2-like protein, putative n=2 Tax=Trichomonas vaginalis TaxID=5722 RepID=A2FUN8_TRIV3|nr:silent information regulator 2 (sir2)-like protein [Trichomonas vaginalis G3]EAX91386.1 silent information regulator 2-like protein, putative [Trichomonas vaginalis G3]KAI5483612.1 silent information regulator 2 (sir2)-like protein [Trichomonas vaginalis G3]|eukprot:XP_001304316.1 silent information regulator 2-like protein [Trichomonas vaginalis G3]